MAKKKSKTPKEPKVSAGDTVVYNHENGTCYTATVMAMEFASEAPLLATLWLDLCIGVVNKPVGQRLISNAPWSANQHEPATWHIVEGDAD